MDSVPAYVIALYIRRSTEDSKVDSCSIESQRRILRKYVESMEDIQNPDVREFVDNGCSGTNFEQPAIQELLDLVRAGGVNCIIVKDFTRFGRNAIEVGYFMEMVFPLYGIRFISLGDDFDSSRYHNDTGGVNVAFIPIPCVKKCFADAAATQWSLDSANSAYLPVCIRERMIMHHAMD